MEESPKATKTAKKEDIRIIKSKRDLRNAMVSLLKENKPYSSISVIDICDRAMINRMTFYKHFKGKDELFSECVLDQGKRIIDTAHARVVPLKQQGCTVTDIIKKYIEAIVEVADDNREIVQAIVRTDESVALHIMARDIRNYFSEAVDIILRRKSLMVSKDFAVNVLMCAFVGVLYDWLRDSKGKSKETLISEYFFVTDRLVSVPDGVIFK